MAWKDKATEKAYHKARYASNREAVKARVRAYASANKQKIQSRNKNYREKNALKLKARSKAYYQAHREERIAYQKARHATKPEAVKAYKKQWWWGEKRPSHLAKKFANYHANRDVISAKQRIKYATNPWPFKAHEARRRAMKRTTQVEHVDLKQILRDSKWLCGICKKPFDLFGIDFDHKIPLSKGGSHTSHNIQATHARCNRAKGAKVG